MFARGDHTYLEEKGFGLLGKYTETGADAINKFKLGVDMLR